MAAGMTFYEIAWYFMIYSFGGWCIEVIYHAITAGRVINRGFLCGPVCPVYGFGALSVFAMTKSLLPGLVHISESTLEGGHDFAGILVVFFGGMILTTAVELAAGWLLDIAFHARWWDYSDQPFNLHGYICVRFSIIWGLAVVLVVRVVQPSMEDSLLLRIPERFGWPFLAVSYGFYLADFVVTVMIVAGLNRKLKELDELQKRMRVFSDGLSEKIGTGTMRAQQTMEEQRVQAALAKYETRDAIRKQLKELQDNAEKLSRALMSGRVFGSRRILAAFPRMRHRRYEDVLLKIQEMLPGPR